MIRIVPKESPRLSIEDAKSAAHAAYQLAKRGQDEVVRHLNLGWMLARPGNVSIYRLRSERDEAQRQVERAQVVVDALNVAVEAIEAGARGGVA